MKLKGILIFFVTFLLPIVLLGQTGPDPCPPEFPDCVPTKAPITGGIIYLLIAALGIGIKAFSKKKKN